MWRSWPARSRSTGWVSPVGKQDQYIAAVGGLTAFEFRADGRVIPIGRHRPARRESGSRRTCSSSTPGTVRIAATRLSAGHQAGDLRSNLDDVKQAGRGQGRLCEGRPARLRLAAHRAVGAEVPAIAVGHPRAGGRWIEGLDAGGLGGKLVGAGGGGFLLFYAEDKADLRVAMAELGLRGGPLRHRLPGRSVIIS